MLVLLGAASAYALLIGNLYEGGSGFSDTEKLRAEFLQPAPDRACIPAGRREYLFVDADKFNRRKFRGAV